MEVTINLMQALSPQLLKVPTEDITQPAAQTSFVYVHQVFPTLGRKVRILQLGVDQVDNQLET